MLRGFGFAIGLFACFLFWKSGWADRLVDLIKPAELSITDRVTDARARVKARIKTRSGIDVSDSEIEDLALLVLVEGGTQESDYYPIAMAAKNYLKLHSGSSYRKLWKSGRLVLHESQMRMYRTKSGIHTIVAPDKSPLYDKALVIASMVLKGEIPKRYVGLNQWSTCVSRLHRAKSVGTYIGWKSRARTLRKLLNKFGNPRFIAPGGTKLFCAQ